MPLARPGKSLLREMQDTAPALPEAVHFTSGNTPDIPGAPPGGGGDELEHNDLPGRDAADCHPASSITNTPAGGIVAVEVQAAIDELDDEKLARDGTQAMTGDLSMGTHQINDVVDPLLDQDAATKKYVDDSISTAAEWEDDGTNTLVPSTANDNVQVDVDLAQPAITVNNINAAVGAEGISATTNGGAAVHGTSTDAAGVYGESDSATGVYGKSGAGNAVTGFAVAAPDRTAETYGIYTADRALLGAFADLIERPSPENAPADRGRIYVCDDPRGIKFPYFVDDAGKTSPMCNGVDYGDGSDGNVTINADTQLSRNMYYNTLTVNATKTLEANGFAVFVRGLCTNNGTITGIKAASLAGATGGNGVLGAFGAGGAAGATIADGYIAGSGAAAGGGGNGGVGGIFPGVPGIGANGTAGAARAQAFLNTGGQSGGNGGAPGGGSGGAAGAATQITAAAGMPRNIVAVVMWAIKGFTMWYANAASGGGGGGGGGIAAQPGATGGGGGGGGGAGGNAPCVALFARWIVNNGTISTVGGAGEGGGQGGDGSGARANGGNGGGGGSGGQGGVLAIGCEYYGGTSPFPVAATECMGGAFGAGGLGGAGFGGGVPGSAGVVGTIGNSGAVIDLRN